MGTNNNIAQNLFNQVDKLHRHSRLGAYRTRERYYEAVNRFCLFLAMLFRLQKFSNVAPKHVFAYVAFLQENGLAPSTIKTDLSGIRYYHDLLDNPRYSIPDNSELNLERRRFVGVDRTWSEAEFARMIDKAIAEGRDNVACALILGRFAGLRIHEVMRIDTATAEHALREGALTVKGKGGKMRSVPIERECVRNALETMLKRTSRGHKLFVSDDMPTDEAIYRLQLYIYKHRDEVQAEGREADLTFHGLRHSYAVEKYLAILESGLSEEAAHRKISQLLGHERADVTDIYLASIRKKKEEEEKNAN